ncbi:hypothetical protein [Acinetobacter sp. A47]|uniref:hypothetical protein n=1 Tax=Acinetobacter sp. A47 TaxID=1561217 RepID=UPI0005714ECE|nr:hypothetical protein [Acinetobacter sp. A47]
MQEKKYLNNEQIPLALAVFLATDNYDHEEGVLSATSLIKPVRQLVLERRLKEQEAEPLLEDISGLVASRMGSAIHDAIERSWTVSPAAALKALGYPQRVIDRIRVNPEKPEPNTIPIYMELRSYKQVGPFKVSGKFDFVGEGMVQDFKSTGVFTFINQTNADKYILQGSIYRWLNPDIITRDVMWIHYIFTDWSKIDAMRNPKYPQSRTVSQKFQLLSYEQTDNYIKRKLSEVERLADAPDNEIPLCSSEDLWRTDPVYKYYKDPSKMTKSTKNFDNLGEAAARQAKDGGKGIIKTVPGQVKACRYCKCFSICGQKDALIKSGELVL